MAAATTVIGIDETDAIVRIGATGGTSVDLDARAVVSLLILRDRLV